MKVTTHLISAPWSALNYPSMQLGALKAYLDQVFKHRTRTLAYSAFLGIAYEWKQNLAFEACQEWRQHEELPYLLLFQRRFLRSKAKTPLPANELALLDQATTAYIDREILPNLAESGVNVIGFTLNYHQTYASLFFERYLRERAGNKKLLFLYGGYGAYAKSFEKTLRQIDAGGYVVVGEGEKKLELVIEYLLGLAEGAPIGLPDIAGVIPSRPAGAGLRTQTSERDFSS
ncbi:MAG: hypothetical protein ACXVBC_13120 [Bdellovibrionota bacterium]